LTEVARPFNVPRGTAYITYQQIITYSVSFVYYVLLIRILNLAQIGEVSLLVVAMSIFTTFTQLSIPDAATRFISANIRSHDKSAAGAVTRTTLRLLLIFAGPGLLLAIVASPWIGLTIFKTANTGILLVVTFAAAFLVDLTALFGAYFLGLGRYANMVYQNVLYVPLSRGLGLILAYWGLGPLGIPLGWAIGAFATLLLSIYLWKGSPSSSSSYPVRPLLLFSLPLFASSVVTLLQGWGDIALLQGILGQFGTTGAYYIVISSVTFLSILWTPVAGALYPALSHGYAGSRPQSVTSQLGVAMRLVNLTVLPTGAALAAMAPTALEAVYGNALGNQAIPFAILAATIVFAAQSLLLITTLQAVGRTTHVLGISLAAVMIDFAAVGLGATALGTTAGAIGRALMAISMTFLSWLSLRTILHAPVTKGLSKALVVALCSAAPLILVDNLLTLSVHMAPVLRLPTLLAVFTSCFLAASRALSAFTEDDFDLLENALPQFLSRPLMILELLVTRNRTLNPRDAV
jgi:O-antigen/teichoic acid export membrane protein